MYLTVAFQRSHLSDNHGMFFLVSLMFPKQPAFFSKMFVMNPLYKCVVLNFEMNMLLLLIKGKDCS